MSCSIAPPLLRLYTNKLNIYDNPNFIPLPPWVSCPAPPMQIIAPAIVTQTPCGPSILGALAQPQNQVGSYYVYPTPGSNATSVPSKSCQSCQ
jgi:hypothetical protein